MKFELAPDNRGASDEILVDDLRRVAGQLGQRSVTREQYDDCGKFHSTTIRMRLGSWNRALQLAGLDVDKRMNISREECLADLRRAASQLNKNCMSIKEYKQSGQFTEGPFYRHFGTWAAAVNAAGLEISNHYFRRKTDEELFQNIETVWMNLGRQPKREDMREPSSSIGPDAYRRRFGSWKKALHAFVEFMSTESEKSVNQCESNENSSTIMASQPAAVLPIYEHKTQRNVSWRLRFIVMRRDTFKCRYCGASPATIPGVILEVDHIVPWSKGGETVFNNLQTLCQTCNGGKSDLIDGEI